MSNETRYYKRIKPCIFSGQKGKKLSYIQYKIYKSVPGRPSSIKNELGESVTPVLGKHLGEVFWLECNSIGDPIDKNYKHRTNDDGSRTDHPALKDLTDDRFTYWRRISNPSESKDVYELGDYPNPIVTKQQEMDDFLNDIRSITEPTTEKTMKFNAIQNVTLFGITGSEAQITKYSEEDLLNYAQALSKSIDADSSVIDSLGAPPSDESFLERRIKANKELLAIVMQELNTRTP